MGAYHTGSCFWFTIGGVVLWTAPARVAGGLCTLVWGLLSAQVGTVSVAALPVVVGQEPSQCGRPPQGSSFLALGLGAQPCLCLIGAVGLCLCVCVCLFVSVSLWVFMGVGGLVCFIIVVFSLCEALCVAFKV